MKTVADIMQQDVATVTPETTVRSLVRFLSDLGISGVPVVTDSGALVGVVSATDVIRRAADAGALSFAEEADREEVAAMYYMPDDPEWTVLDWTAIDPELHHEELTVGDIMTPVSFGVSPETTVPEVADFMVRGRIHRALVLDEGRLLGLVSAMDVLRVVAEEGVTIS